MTRSAFAAASILALTVLAVALFGDDSRNMFVTTPVYAPSMTYGQSAAPAFTPSAPVAAFDYAPAYAQEFAQPIYVQPADYAQAEESSTGMPLVYAAAGALLVGAAGIFHGRQDQSAVAETDLESATSAARVATLAVSGRKPPVPKQNAVYKNPSAQAKIAANAMNNPMNFNGWMPETVNGRLAQVGFIAAIAGEITTKQTVVE
jgi:hypothetical protein